MLNIMKFCDIIEKFPNEETLVERFIKIRYRTGLCCPHCGCKKVYHRHIAIRNFKCANCNNEFSIFTNTILEKSSTDLRKWFYTIHIMRNGKNRIPALQLQREIKVSYKTAWRMLKQIRSAMGNSEDKKMLTETIQICRSSIGIKTKNQLIDKDDNKDKRDRVKSKTDIIGK